MCIDNPWKPLRPNWGSVERVGFYQEVKGLDGILQEIRVRRLETLENYLERYLATVQKWDVEKIKLYFKNTKNVKVKGTEMLQKVNRQGSNLEYWCYGVDCIMVTDKYTLEIVEVGDWIK